MLLAINAAVGNSDLARLPIIAIDRENGWLCFARGKTGIDHGIRCDRRRFPMRAAAAFDRPRVVIAGGREPWWWAVSTNTDARQFGETASPDEAGSQFFGAGGPDRNHWLPVGWVQGPVC